MTSCVGKDNVEVPWNQKQATAQNNSKKNKNPEGKHE